MRVVTSHSTEDQTTLLDLNASVLYQATLLVDDDNYASQRYLRAHHHLATTPLDELLVEYARIRRVLHRPDAPHGPERERLTFAAHLTVLVARASGSDEVVLEALAQFARQHPDEGALVATEVFYERRYPWLIATGSSPALGLLTREVFEALHCTAFQGQTASRARYLSLRLRHLGLSAAEITVGRFLLADWPGTVADLVVATQRVSATLSPSEADLVAAFDQNWRGPLATLLETVHLLAAS